MAALQCKECGVEIPSDSKKCPGCGASSGFKRKISLLTKIEWAIVVVLVVWALNNQEAIRQALSSFSSDDVVCEIQNVKGEATLVFHNGEMEMGEVVRLSVRNISSQRKLVIDVDLSTSEGNFKRQQAIHFADDETKHLSYQFHEPTVNASNVYPTASCRPG